MRQLLGLVVLILVAALPVLFLVGDKGLPEEPEVRASTTTTVATTSSSTTTTAPPSTTTTARPVHVASVARPKPPVSNVPPSERWLALADCESGDGDGRAPYTMNDTYRGLHHGALQWNPGTWKRARELSGLPVAEDAADAPFADEVAVAKVWLRATSPKQWPVCGPKVGLTMADAS